MSIASRNGKLRVAAEDDGTRFRRLEDLLTADVFGAYRYLPTRMGVGPLLANAVSTDGIALRAWTEERGVLWGALAFVSFAFWPSLAGKEPDVVVALGDAEDRARIVVLVEVKLHADQHTIDGVSQLGFYGTAMLDNLFDEDPFEVALPTLRPVVLVTKEADRPTSVLARVRSELGDHHEQGRTDVFWVSWTTAATLAVDALAARRREGGPRHELAVLEDLVADLAERGFGPPRQLTLLPLPKLQPLSAAWRPWPAMPRPALARLADVATLRLDPINAALSQWRLR